MRVDETYYNFFSKYKKFDPQLFFGTPRLQRLLFQGRQTWTRIKILHRGPLKWDKPVTFGIQHSTQSKTASKFAVIKTLNPNETKCYGSVSLADNFVLTFIFLWITDWPAWAEISTWVQICNKLKIIIFHFCLFSCYISLVGCLMILNKNCWYHICW